ncbi:hypothetical protein BKA57DRAFT_461084 [Linnemannia elongata]|nr:hypothetical protein BKA57DRAFT_461084 [Linnemannia elongata]
MCTPDPFVIHVSFLGFIFTFFFDESQAIAVVCVLWEALARMKRKKKRAVTICYLYVPYPCACACACTCAWGRKDKQREYFLFGYLSTATDGREYAFAIELHCGSEGRGKRGYGRPSRYLTLMKVFKGTGPPLF